ncbi:hypothetical protein V6N13_075838 [Hibiscus sabdariffa]
MHDAYFSVAILIQKCTALLPAMDISLQVIEMQCFGCSIDITKNSENGRESSGRMIFSPEMAKGELASQMSEVAVD